MVAETEFEAVASSKVKLEIEMFIKEIISQHRRDFKAIYKCEYCGLEKTGSGYDDDNFHENVIPEMICGICSKSGSNDYVSMKAKYPAGYVI